VISLKKRQNRLKFIHWLPLTLIENSQAVIPGGGYSW
jgi:hypothetical protein